MVDQWTLFLKKSKLKMCVAPTNKSFSPEFFSYIFLKRSLKESVTNARTAYGLFYFTELGIIFIFTLLISVLSTFYILYMYLHIYVCCSLMI